jgi:APA family basic amino acid/polyamine antiporter
VLGLSIERLAESSAPVSDLVAVNHPEIATWIVLVSIVAIVNGVLIQMIMASRVLYGMAAQGKAPAYFSTVARRTRTPIKATFVIIFLIWCFALWLPLVTLASLTSFITLIVFMLVNLSLWRVQNHASFVRPIKRLRALPRIGVALCVTLLGFQVASLLSRVQ